MSVSNHHGPKRTFDPCRMCGGEDFAYHQNKGHWVRQCVPCKFPQHEPEMQLIGTPTRIGPVPSAEDVANINELASELRLALSSLTLRERNVIELRYGIGDGYTYTLEEVGRIFKVTKERVRQIEAKAIRKLQHIRRSLRLRPFHESSAE